jgi:hypothetical protein
VSFAAITLYVVSQRVLVAVYFFINSVRKHLDTPSYASTLIVNSLIKCEVFKYLGCDASDRLKLSSRNINGRVQGQGSSQIREEVVQLKQVTVSLLARNCKQFLESCGRAACYPTILVPIFAVFPRRYSPPFCPLSNV